LFTKKRFPARRTRRASKLLQRPRFRKGLKGFLPGPDFLPVLLMIGFIIALILFTYPSGAGAFLNAGYLKTAIVEKIFCVDYLRLLTNSLPGLRPADALPDKEAGLPAKQPPWRDYPRLILSNELAGLPLPGAARVFVPAAAGDSTAMFSDPAAGEAEGLAFLVEKTAGGAGPGAGASAAEGPFNPAAKPLSPLENPDSKPLLLLYHTHASESFLPISGQAFSASQEQTVVHFGAALAKTLREDYGIPLLHHQGVYDQPRRAAYQKAGPAVEKILQQNPQIEVVIDLHRDGAPRKITTTNVAGQDTARILFVIGTRHEGWSGNLRFALFLENFMQEKYPGFSRGIHKNAYDCYNQHLHPRSLIVEIGGHENNKGELLRAVPPLAKALASIFD
jgi:stage II sporulation protein P